MKSKDQKIIEKKDNGLEKKFFPFTFKDLKALEDNPDGTFEGYGSVYNNRDEQNDILMPGTFKTSLEKHGRPKMLWQHHYDEPLGIYTSVIEDENGLDVKGELNIHVQKAREAYSLLKQKAIDGLSIGFRVEDAIFDANNNVRKIIKARLFEISIVTFPANELATITGVKQLPDSERDFEKFLRDAGWSRSHAKAITAHGYKTINTDQREADSPWDANGGEKFIADMKEFNEYLKQTGGK